MVKQLIKDRTRTDKDCSIRKKGRFAGSRPGCGRGGSKGGGSKGSGSGGTKTSEDLANKKITTRTTVKELAEIAKALGASIPDNPKRKAPLIEAIQSARSKGEPSNSSEKDSKNKTKNSTDLANKKITTRTTVKELAEIAKALGASIPDNPKRKAPLIEAIQSARSGEAKTPESPSTPKASSKTKAQKTKAGKEPGKLIPLNKKNQAVDAWQGAFDNAPNDVRAAYNNLPAIAKVLKTEGTAAFFSPDKGYIQMGDLTRGLAADYTWRHEYSHHMDHNVGAIAGKKTFNNALKKQAGLNSDQFFALRKSDPAKFEQIRNGMLEQAQNIDTKIMRPRELNAINKLKDHELVSIIGTGSKYASSTKAGIDARQKDEQRLLSTQKQNEATYIKKFDEILKADPTLQSAGLEKRITGKAAEKGQGKPVDLTKIATNEQKAKYGKLLASEYYLRNNVRPRVNKAGDSKQQDKEYEKILDETLGNDKSVVGSIYRQVKEQKFLVGGDEKLGTIERSKIVEKFVKAKGGDLTGKTVDWTGVADLSDTFLTNGGVASDTLGSITKNKLGFGHSDDYYKAGGEKQGAEAFANIGSLHSSGNKVHQEVGRALAPNFYKFYENTIQSSVEEN